MSLHTPKEVLHRMRQLVEKEKNRKDNCGKVNGKILLRKRATHEKDNHSTRQTGSTDVHAVELAVGKSGSENLRSPLSTPTDSGTSPRGEISLKRPARNLRSSFLQTLYGKGMVMKFIARSQSTDTQWLSIQFFAAKGFNGVARLGLHRHFDEAVALRLSRFPVFAHGRAANCAMGLKKGPQIIVREFQWKVSSIDMHSLSSCFSTSDADNLEEWLRNVK
jgi:hypothetical protein